MISNPGPAIQFRQQLQRPWNTGLQFSNLLGMLIATGLGLQVPALAQQPSNSLEAEARATSETCLDLVYQQDTKQGIASCEQAVVLNRLVGDQRLEAYSLGNLGTLYLQQQNYQQALTQYRQVLALSQTLEDSALEIKALIALGTTHSHVGQFQEALGFYNQALTRAKTVGDGTGTAIALYNLGLTYDRLDQYQAAIEAYQNTITIAQGIGDPILEGYATSKLSVATKALTQVSTTD